MERRGEVQHHLPCHSLVVSQETGVARQQAQGSLMHVKQAYGFTASAGSQACLCVCVCVCVFINVCVCVAESPCAALGWGVGCPCTAEGAGEAGVRGDGGHTEGPERGADGPHAHGQGHRTHLRVTDAV